MNELEQPLKSNQKNSQLIEGDKIENESIEKKNLVIDVNNNSSIRNEETCNNEENLGDCNLEGSNLLGKFNDVNELMKAYNNLQAEFTRKCQKLSLLEKEQEENKNNQKSLNQDDIGMDKKPIYLAEDFSQNLTNFLAQNPNAKQYSSEISLELINDGTLSLTQAYERVLAKKFKEPEELLRDENFIQNYILTNEGLKKELLKEYVKSVKESTVPPLISGNFGISGGGANIEISSLEEANKLALKLFRD